MRVLVIGGSVFLGRAVVAEALALGAEVTVFNRGMSGTPLPGEVHRLIGDRTVPAELDQLRGLEFDLVVDTCGYVPAEVALSVAVLAPTVGHYAFISTVNVFPDWPEQADYHAGGVHEGDPDATRDDLPAGIDDSAAYGWLKVGCERAVVRGFGAERSSVLRAGCIVGPEDAAVGRLPWWIQRVARGGEVLVPGSPQDPMSLIDARDLARFALARVTGTFETPGPVGRDTRADLLAACLAATGSSATLTYVADDWLEGQAVEAWTELPLWIPAREGAGLFAHRPGEAQGAGLTWRPLAETVADTWAWQRGVAWEPSPRTPGLTPAREAELLGAWHTR